MEKIDLQEERKTGRTQIQSVQLCKQEVQKLDKNRKTKVKG